MPLRSVETGALLRLHKRAQQKGRVFHGSSGDARMRVPKNRFVSLFALQDSLRAQEAVGPLKPNDAATGGGQAARTNRIRVQRRVRQAGSNGRGGAGRGAAGNEVFVPGISDGTETTLQACGSHPK